MAASNRRLVRRRMLGHSWIAREERREAAEDEGVRREAGAFAVLHTTAPAAVLRFSNALASIQNKQTQTRRAGGQEVLLAVHHERLRRAGDAADLGVPERLAGRGVPGFDVLTVIGEQQAAGGRE